MADKTNLQQLIIDTIDDTDGYIDLIDIMLYLDLSEEDVIKAFDELVDEGLMTCDVSDDDT